MAKRGKFDAFTSTLLYSKFQKHDRIRELGESVARAVGVPFVYRDFREGWKHGVETSKRLGMYRQQYCGCIYSEKERYFRGETANSGKNG
jgi:predicted adenine nucleotide alpha hydrolase (AANH) superfamily ATPase